ncbi:MAG: sugar ABC transporter permease [Acidimicrobiia bacterium]|nr:sugar ABC transporter permease [Acidimicrobiia bacterium]NND13758.1 sugar ABC transporter permease [Acidimicrobiia bacterium]NNL27743.1 sugar ABC transporter permease [Acidimicrobiia bacterium]
MTTKLTEGITQEDLPTWFKPLVAWRVVVAIIVSLTLAATILKRGIEVEGLLRWTLALGLLGAVVASVLAIRWTSAREHRGRLAGFVLDSLLAVILGFVALNGMGMFTGIDAVGEAFNGSVGWLGIVIIGWLVQGYAARTEAPQVALRQVARWTMITGLVVLLLAVGLIPGIIEFFRRAVQPDVLVFWVIAIPAGMFARMGWTDSAAQLFETTESQTETMDGLLFVAPNALGFLAFFAGPLVVSLFISFTEWDGLTAATFVGFQNYIDLLSDNLFLRSLRNIVVFSALAIPLAVGPALLLASLLNSKLPGMKAFRAVYFLPSIAGVVGVTLIWKQLFNSTVGYLNFMILKATEWINALFGLELEAAQPQWISDSNIALFAVVILFVWQQIGFNTVLFLAGMQGIDRTLYEAAEIDGAGPWRRFTAITVPTLRPTTVFVVATTTILALQLFNEPFILNSPNAPAGPANSTLTPVVYLYQKAFQQFQIGYASAVAWALFILIFGVTLLYFRRGGEDGVLSA